MSHLVPFYSNLSPLFMTLICVLLSAWLFKHLCTRRTFEYKPKHASEPDEVRIKTDPEKAFAKHVKFMMRLKRKMKNFKERKSKNPDEKGP